MQKKIKIGLPKEYIIRNGNSFYGYLDLWECKKIVSDRIERSLRARKKNIPSEVFDRIYYEVSIVEKYNHKIGERSFYTRVSCGRNSNKTRQVFSSKKNKSIDLKILVPEMISIAEKDTAIWEGQQQKWDNYKENDEYIKSLEDMYKINYGRNIQVSATDGKDLFRFAINKVHKKDIRNIIDLLMINYG